MTALGPMTNHAGVKKRYHELKKRSWKPRGQVHGAPGNTVKVSSQRGQHPDVRVIRRPLQDTGHSGIVLARHWNSVILRWCLNARLRVYYTLGVLRVLYCVVDTLRCTSYMYDVVRGCDFYYDHAMAVRLNVSPKAAETVARSAYGGMGLFNGR